jgi:hypothetical protein
MTLGIMDDNDELLRRKHWRPVNDGYMNFGDALDLLKRGFHVQRDGWNGKGMFLWFMPEKDPLPIDNALADSLNTATGGAISFGPYIVMKTAQNNHVPWLASQTDLIAEDWRIRY